MNRDAWSAGAHFEELLGYSNEELSRNQLKLLDLMPEVHRASVKEAWQRVMRGEKVGFEADGLRKDGSTIPFYYTAAKADVDNQAYVLGTGVDITELKRTEAALKEAYDIIRAKSPIIRGFQICQIRGIHPFSLGEI